MTRTLLLFATTGAVAIGAALLSPAPLRADPYPPGTYPNGSYRKTCTNIHFKTGDPYMLVANCQPKDSSSAAPMSMLKISHCKDGTITNEDGKLSCPWDWHTQDIADAAGNMSAFRSAGVIIMGRDPDMDTTIKWMRFGYTKAKFITQLDQHTLDFTEATQILKAYLMEQATPQERHDVYAAAYKQVYGTPPGIIAIPGMDYDAQIKAGKAWYATIVTAERQKKNAPAPAPTNTAPLPPIH